MKRILLIGNSSMLGRRIISKLSVNNQIFTTGRNDRADVFFDLEHGVSDLPPDLQCSVIVHCAASFGDDTLEGAIKNELINGLGAYHVAKLAVQVKCEQLITISSISVYNHPENEYFGSYSLSKLHGEDILSHYCGISNIQFLSLRLSQMYDETGEARRHQPMFYQIVEKAMHGENIVFYGKKNPLRNFIYVGDVVTIIEQSISKRIGSIFPVVFPESYTLTQISEIAYDVFQKAGRISFLEEKNDIKSIYIPPISKLFALIGYTPDTDLRNGISLIRKSYETGCFK